MMFDIYYDFAQNAALTGNLIMYDGYLLDVNKVFNASMGGEGNQYGIVGSDYGAVQYLKESLTALKDVFIPENTFDRLNNEFENGIDALPVIETGQSIYLLFELSWGNGANFSESVKGIDIVGTNTISLPVKQYTGN